jgi:hypothetical protein
MKTWLKGETARVQTPSYVRDNMPVSLLAKAYAAFVGDNAAHGTTRRLDPSSYPASQGAFTGRLRAAVAARLGLPCRLELGTQTEFPEPPVRVNTDLLDPEAWGGTRRRRGTISCAIIGLRGDTTLSQHLRARSAGADQTACPR